MITVISYIWLNLIPYQVVAKMSTVIRSVKYGGLYSPAEAVAKMIAVIRLVKCGCIDSPAGSCENDHHHKISHKHRCLLSFLLLALCCSDFSMHAFFFIFYLP